MGLWGSWFVAPIAITRIWYFSERLCGRAPPFPRPEPELPGRNTALPADFAGAELAAAAQAAGEALPGLRISRIIFPGNRAAPLTVQGDLSAMLVRPRANSVHIDPASGDIAGSYRGEVLDFHTRIAEAADPLHFGYFGGIASKIIWFVFGLMMTAMSITGVVINATRLRRSVLASATFSPGALWAGEKSGGSAAKAVDKTFHPVEPG